MAARCAKFLWVIGFLLLVGCSGLTNLIDGGEADVITPEIVQKPTDAPLVSTEAPAPTIEAVPTDPPPAEAELLADLEVTGVTIEAEVDTGCLDDQFRLVTRVFISNIGSQPAGPFDVAVNDQIVTFAGQLIPGDTGSVLAGGASMQVLAVADPQNRIVESNENNNIFDQPVPIPTPPPPCEPTAEPIPEASAVNAISLDWVAGGFAKPLLVTHANDDRLFVVEQQGTIRSVSANGEVGNTPFLNIIDRTNSGRNEQGLLGLAFHPDYQTNGRLFVNYTHADGSTVVSEFSVTADANLADGGSERQLMKIGQPYANHNGGMIAFGPDGYLYIGMGDGGSQNDPENHGQNLESLLGKMLRIDVDNGEPYGIPADNPFVNDPAARNEIWSYGWRNPWRFSFDQLTGEMYIGDVGQFSIEEISLNPAGVGGLNFGWRVFEGNECYLDDCAAVQSEPAIASYNHDNGHCSVTGGIMSRNTDDLSLFGNYLFADYCSSQIWRLFPNGDGSFEMTPLAQPGFFISSFGDNAAGDIYVVNQTGGEIYKVVGGN